MAAVDTVVASLSLGPEDYRALSVLIGLDGPGPVSRLTYVPDIKRDASGISLAWVTGGGNRRLLYTPPGERDVRYLGYLDDQLRLHPALVAGMSGVDAEQLLIACLPADRSGSVVQDYPLASANDADPVPAGVAVEVTGVVDALSIGRYLLKATSMLTSFPASIRRHYSYSYAGWHQIFKHSSTAATSAVYAGAAPRRSLLGSGGVIFLTAEVPIDASGRLPPDYIQHLQGIFGSASILMCSTAAIRMWMRMPARVPQGRTILLPWDIARPLVKEIMLSVGDIGRVWAMSTAYVPTTHAGVTRLGDRVVRWSDHLERGWATPQPLFLSDPALGACSHGIALCLPDVDPTTTNVVHAVLDPNTVRSCFS